METCAATASETNFLSVVVSFVGGLIEIVGWRDRCGEGVTLSVIGVGSGGVGATGESLERHAVWRMTVSR